MQTVAEIAAIGRDPGLVAFLCTYCGATDSALTRCRPMLWSDQSRSFSVIASSWTRFEA